MIRTAVVLALIMPMAASSAMMAAIVEAGVSPGTAIMSSPTEHTQVIASSLSMPMAPMLAASIIPSSSDTGMKAPDSPPTWLEAIAPVNAAINQAGLSVKDYFVAGIAIAAAERFITDPKAAPPTPSLTRNAEFLRSHTADLEKLHTQEGLRPVVVSKP